MRLLKGSSICCSVNLWNLVRLGLVLLFLMQFGGPMVMGQGIVTGSIAGTVQDQQGRLSLALLCMLWASAPGLPSQARRTPRGTLRCGVFRSARTACPSRPPVFAVCT